MSKSCTNSPTPNSPEKSIYFIAEERAKVLKRHQKKRETDYAKNIGLIKTGIEQDEPDIVSNFPYCYYYFITFVLFKHCVLFKHQINLILFCF